MATSFTPELGIRIRFSDYKTDWRGTRAQLEAEGFIPEDTVWPVGKKFTRFENATAWFCLYRVGGDGTAPTEQTLYRVHHYSQKHDGTKRQLAKKLREALDIAAIGGPEWTAAYHKHYEARRDDAFQAFKRALLGQKKRGRPGAAAKNTTSINLQGA